MISLEYRQVHGRFFSILYKSLNFIDDEERRKQTLTDKLVHASEKFAFNEVRWYIESL